MCVCVCVLAVVVDVYFVFFAMGASVLVIEFNGQKGTINLHSCCFSLPPVLCTALTGQSSWQNVTIFCIYDTGQSF